ncbi:MAG: S8 family peptidase [Actinobacteria bacterium]|nr:S8 family peptidase [Actinomycetota bacterium]
MATRESTPGEPQRPLLANGEALRLDAERTSGGGPKWHPRDFEEARRHLLPQVQGLQKAVADTPAELRGTRVVFEATVLPNYLANSYFPAELFREADLIPVGTRATEGLYATKTKKAESKPTKTFLLAGDERSLGRIGHLLGDAAEEHLSATLREGLRQFDLIRLPTLDEVVRSRPPIPEGDLLTWEAVLHPSPDIDGRLTAAEQESVMAKWQDWVHQLGGQVAADYRRSIRGMTFMPVRLPAGAADEAARFNPLRALRPMPKVRPAPIDPLRVATTSEQLPAPAPGQRPQSDVRVAVFDGGVDTRLPHLAPFVDHIDVTPLPANAEMVAHGTMVTSAALFGPLDAGQLLQTPDVGVDHFRVLPAPSPDPWDVDLYWILDQIVALVSARQYRVVNLSLGPALPVDDQSEPHAWTAQLDELAERHGVLFVTAAGNNGADDAHSGLNRIQIPADMANGLGVGACDRRPPEPTFSRAPYSAVGPGRHGARMQPAGVSFGGTADTPFRGMVSGSRFGEATGTSFAAPTATHGLSGLVARLGSGAATPEVLRAFAIHFAHSDGDARCEEIGFGRLLERYDEAWECPEHEVTVLYRDTINRDEVVALPFPLPSDAVKGKTVDLRWTLAFTAPTDPTDAVDYTQAGLEVAFRPHAQRYNFRDPKTQKSVELDVQKQGAEVVRQLRAGAIPSALPATKSPTRRRNEAYLREEGKWETALHYTKHMRASSLFEPRITVNYLAREGGALTSATPLEYAMLLSIRAPRGVRLYEAVRQSYSVLAPLTAQIPLRLRS